MTGVLVGLILGDANIRRPGKNGNPHIQFNQGFVHLEYVLFVFSLNKQFMATFHNHLQCTFKKF